MQKISQLKQQAIQAAREQNWQEAVEYNSQILEQNNKDLEAMNRLGLAYMQQKKLKEAKKVFNDVLCIDKSNIIANKHLKTLKKNKVAPAVNFDNTNFIEEPGKTKIIELLRLARKEILQNLSCGQECKLITKNRFISIETDDKQYIGALPEDLSFRLTKLIKSGNIYACTVKSCNEKQCSVLIRETCKSEKNCNTQSFPAKGYSMSSPSTSTTDVL